MFGRYFIIRGSYGTYFSELYDQLIQYIISNN